MHTSIPTDYWNVLIKIQPAAYLKTGISRQWLFYKSRAISSFLFIQVFFWSKCSPLFSICLYTQMHPAYWLILEIKYRNLSCQPVFLHVFSQIWTSLCLLLPYIKKIRAQKQWNPSAKCEANNLMYTQIPDAIKQTLEHKSFFDFKKLV